MVDSTGPLSANLGPVGSEKTQQVGELTKNTDGKAGGASFKEYLTKSIQEVNKLQQDADHAIQDISMGKRDDYAGVITAVEKADIAFQTLMKVRSKLLDAYQQFNRMNV